MTFFLSRFFHLSSSGLGFSLGAVNYGACIGFSGFLVIPLLYFLSLGLVLLFDYFFTHSRSSFFSEVA